MAPAPGRWNALKAKKEAALNRPRPQRRRDEEALAARGITRMVKWFEKRGFNVSFGPRLNDEVFLQLRMVTIRSRSSLRSQLISLLHEAGHILLEERPSYDERFGVGWNLVARKNDKRKMTAAHRVQVLEEEIEAWNRGKGLSGRLRISVDEKLWNRIRYRCISSYSHYASQKQHPIRVPVAQPPRTLISPARGLVGSAR